MSGGVVNVSAGGTASNTFGNGGNIWVSSGALAISTLLVSNGRNATAFVLNGGTANSTIVSSGASISLSAERVSAPC